MEKSILFTEAARISDKEMFDTYMKCKKKVLAKMLIEGAKPTGIITTSGKLEFIRFDEENRGLPKPPKFPIPRIIAHNRIPDGGYSLCPYCGSSRKSGWRILKSYNYCINPECEYHTKPIK